jgi:hypothetical protein
MKRRFLPPVFAIILSLLFMSCGSTRKMLKSSSELGSGQAVLIGKFELHPPLEKGEQDIAGGLGNDSLFNMFFLINDAKAKKINFERAETDFPNAPEWKDRLDAKFGEVFYAGVRAEPLYLYAGGIVAKLYYVTRTTTTYMSNGMGGMTPMTSTTSVPVYKFTFMPLSKLVNISPADKAVYIGTVHIYRNEFKKITKVLVKDEWKALAADFQAKFPGMKPRKAGMQDVDFVAKKEK